MAFAFKQIKIFCCWLLCCEVSFLVSHFYVSCKKHQRENNNSGDVCASSDDKSFFLVHEKFQINFQSCQNEIASLPSALNKIQDGDGDEVSFTVSVTDSSPLPRQRNPRECLTEQQ